MTATVGPGVTLLKCHACKHLSSLGDTLLELNRLSGGQYAGLALQMKARERELALESLDFSAAGVTRQTRTTPDTDYTVFLADLLRVPMLPLGRDVLAAKGVDPDFAIEQFYCTTVPAGYTDDGMGTDRYDNPKTTKAPCLVFPILVSPDVGIVRCVGAQVRPLAGNGLKYWTIWPFVSGRHLFGEHLLPYGAGKPLSLVEGPFDAMHLVQLGARAAGINGLAFSAEKAKLIRASEPSLVGILLDPDVEGQNAAKNVNKVLTKHGVPSMLYHLDQDPKYLTQQDLSDRYSSLL